jgi:hypothetical protein
MKSPFKTVLKILGIVLLICATGFSCIYVLPVAKLFRDSRKQMIAGQKYMDSLNEKDFQAWVERTQKYLSTFNATNWVIEADNLPHDLKELKILSIYFEDSNSVDYVWMGGFDHTMLHVERLTNEQFRFTAIYNDNSNRIIWPRLQIENQQVP